MGFLVEADYSVQIRAEIKAVLTQTDASLDLCEQMAQAEISAYLRPRGYDLAVLFGLAGSARPSDLIMRMIDVTLYHLHTSVVTRATPAKIEKRYNDAVTWMKNINGGDLDPDFPKLEDNPTPTLRLGSNTKYFKRY